MIIAERSVTRTPCTRTQCLVRVKLYIETAALAHEIVARTLNSAFARGPCAQVSQLQGSPIYEETAVIKILGLLARRIGLVARRLTLHAFQPQECTVSREIEDTRRISLSAQNYRTWKGKTTDACFLNPSRIDFDGTIRHLLFAHCGTLLPISTKTREEVG